MITIIPTWLYTPLICIAIGGLLMAVIMRQKQKAAQKYQNQQANKEKSDKEIQP